MNKYNKAKILLLLIVSICLYFSNTVVVYIDSKVHNRKVLEKIDNVQIEKHDKVYYGIAGVGSFNNLMQTIYIYGYAVAETEYNNTNRIVDLYLVSDENIYHTLPNITWNEVLQFGLKHLNIPDGTHVGFNAEFSAINMKDGEYKLYIAVSENDKNYGIVYSKKVIIKKGKNITIETLPEFSKEKNNISSIINNTIKYGIDKEEVQNNILNLQGWLFDTSDNYTGKVYIHIKDANNIDKYYETEVEERTDVGRYYKNDALINSGFQAYIKVADEEAYEITGLVLEKDGVFYEKLIDVSRLKSSSKEIKHIIPSDNIRYGIDKQEVKNNVLSIQGWLFDKSDNYTGRVYVHVKDENNADKYYKTNIEKRIDVSKYYKNDALVNSGFNVTIKLPDNAGYEIQGFILEKNGIYYEKAVTLKQSNEFFSKETAIQNVVPSDNIQYGIDKQEMKNNILSIQGWLFDKSDTYTGRVYVHVKDENNADKYYKTNIEKRIDVSKYYKNDALVNSGFNVTIKLPDNAGYEIQGFILEKNGIYYEKAVALKQANEIFSKETAIQNVVPSDNIQYGIDKQEMKNNVLSIQGWLFDKSDNYTGRVYVHVKDSNNMDKYYETNMEKRVDVGKYYKNDALVNSGFTVTIKLPDESGYEIQGFVLEKNNMFYEKK